MSAKYPKTCKAVVLPAQHEKLVVKEVEVRKPQAGEILIKVHACGVCHSDNVVIEGQMGPLYVIPTLPFFLISMFLTLW
jgi:D-arabinose 1-dehydrogenase-like Zn-dependent alcohol dehydrogenase